MSREQISKRTNRYLFLYLYLTFPHCFKRNRTHKATRYRSKHKYNLHDYDEKKKGRLFVPKRRFKWLYDLTISVLQSWMRAV